MNPACWLVWFALGVPAPLEMLILVGLALVFFGRSPTLTRRVGRWLRPWREDQHPTNLQPLVVVAVVSAAVTALLMLWIQQISRPLP